MIFYGAEGITTPRIPVQDNDYIIAFAVWKCGNRRSSLFCTTEKQRQQKNETKKKEPSNDRRFRRRKRMGFYGAMDNGNHLFTFPFFFPPIRPEIGKRAAGRNL